MTHRKVKFAKVLVVFRLLVCVISGWSKWSLVNTVKNVFRTFSGRSESTGDPMWFSEVLALEGDLDQRLGHSE